MKTKSILTFLFIAYSVCFASAQWDEPVSFSVLQTKKSASEIIVTFKGTIAPGWHVYSTNIDQGGPTPATFNVDKSKGIKPIGKLRTLSKAQHHIDEIFNMEVSYFENSCVFEQHFTIMEKDYSLKGYLEYGACNDQNCTPPTAVDISIEGNDGPVAEVADNIEKANDETAETPTTIDTIKTAPSTTAATTPPDLWSDKTQELKALSADHTATQHDTTLWWLFVMGLMAGILALVTPCVWPIIPMTVSFFLKRSEKKSHAIRDAVIYGISIVVIYVSLGLIITLLFDSDTLNSLSTNAIVNIFFFTLLIVFGLSFLGLFEITLPSSWSNKTDQKAESTTGLISIFIMAFTLALVSFSCTGPVIGFMLVEVASIGNILGPFVAMLGFAIALAVPFTIFALFPTLLKKAPKSGSWMNTVKVILAFIEFAFALKFFSVADLSYGWHILDRDVFIAIWIVLATTLGLYLLGLIKLPIDGRKRPKRTKTKTLLALCSLAFVVYMVPGLLGKPLETISAFTPPMYTQHIRVYKTETVEAQFKDYEQGMAYAQQNNKFVIIDFTGFGCVNCREMEQKVWNDPRVANILRNDIVLISLYVDDKTPLSSHVEVTERGKQKTLRTIGDKWSHLQRTRFGVNAQPFYVLCNPQGDPIKPAYTFDTDADKFVDFLTIGK